MLLITIRLVVLNRKLKGREKHYKEVNRRVVTAVNHTDTLIVSLNKHGIIRLVNEAAIQVHKSWVNADLKAGRSITEATSNSVAGGIWKSWLEKSRNVHSWSEVCKMSIEGQARYFRVNFSSIQANDGAYTGLVMMGTDVTYEHEFQSDLVDQHKALEKSNTDKEHMMGILAHDLKDAIYSAHSMSKMVLEEEEDFDRDHLLRLFKILHDNFEKTQGLLESLLAWQKTRNVALEARHQNIKLYELINEVIENQQDSINNKDLRVFNEVSKDLTLTTDREMLRTVLRNLLSNAIKYTHPGKGEIRFSCETDGGTVIHVRDNGEGMSEEDIQSVLNCCRGLSKPGTNKENGTGIGLYLCQELLRINQSELQIKSAPGEGSDFYFRLRG